jgi:hypothetical protein
MSLTFTNIKDKIRRVTGANTASYSDAEITTDVNLALDEVFLLALRNNGWNVDDYNHTHDPFITTNLVASQRDYHFTVDEQSNRILEIYKVMVKDNGGTFHEITPVDQQSDANSTFYDGQNSTGTPTTYDKTGNGIFLDLIPSYSSTGGLKVFISREPSYFLSTDTTKVAGIDGLTHDYLYLKPAYEYARDKGLPIAERLYRDLLDARKKVDERYGRREKDTIKRLIPASQNNK